MAAIREEDTVRIKYRVECLVHAAERDAAELESDVVLLTSEAVEPGVKLDPNLHILDKMDEAAERGSILRAVMADGYGIADNDRWALLGEPRHGET
jgi:hypothetical protein